jgi:hypothetical protein
MPKYIFATLSDRWSCNHKLDSTAEYLLTKILGYGMEKLECWPTYYWGHSC